MIWTVRILIILAYWGGGGGGEHFADIPEGRCGANWRSQRLAMQQSANDTIPHNGMLEHVITRDLHCP